MVRSQYQQKYDIALSITFDGDHVALDIPDDGTKTDNGWEIVPVQKAHVSKIENTQLRSELNISLLPMSFHTDLGMRIGLNNNYVSILDQAKPSG